MNPVQMEQNAVGRWRAEGGLQVNARDLQHIVSHETLLVPEKEERSRVRAVQMHNLRGLIGIRRMDRVLNARIRKLCGVKKGLDEMTDEGVLRWRG